MGILTYVKIGAAALVLAVLGYLVWNYQHMQTVIAGQKEQIASLQLAQEVLFTQQEKFRQFMAARSSAARKVTNEQAEITQSVESGNDADLDRRLQQYWLRPAPGGAAAPGRKGGAANAAPGAP